MHSDVKSHCAFLLVKELENIDAINYNRIYEKENLYMFFKLFFIIFSLNFLFINLIKKL
ncbi:hypothetical protein CFSAN002369_13025 [Clostridium botulinum CFSAN002369]|nr:hypothetical protein CFSAN002369_13025 [Clostridium botulinum CFSAN002369]